MLAVVIVGLAIMVGIQGFSEGQEKAEYDRLTAVALDASSDILAWKARPQALGGGRRVAFLTGLTWPAVSREAAPGDPTRAPSDAGYFLTLTPGTRASNGVHLNVLNAERGIGVQLLFYGLTEDCLQLRRQHRDPTATYPNDVTGWEHTEPSWEDAGTIPAACPAAW